MSAPFNGWQANVSIQRETTFNAASNQPVYNLVGKTRLTQGVEFVGRGRTVNVWRNEHTNFFAGQFYAGTIEVELGLNAIVALLLQVFFDVESQSSVSSGIGGPIIGEGMDIFGESGPLTGEGVNVTKYVLRPPRLQGVKSFKIGIDFEPASGNEPTIFGEISELFGEGGPILGESTSGPKVSVLYSGVVIDSLALTVARNQVPKLVIQYKAALRSKVSSPALTDAITDDLRRVHHTFVSAMMDSQGLGALTEATLNFNQQKNPSRFTTAKAPGRFAAGGFAMTGQLAEYFGPDSVFPTALIDQNDHVLFLALNDPAGSARKLEVYWPRINFNDSLPDAIGRADLAYRAGFTGLQDTEFDSSGPKIVLVV